jgi:hypothetical protein
MEGRGMDLCGSGQGQVVGYYEYDDGSPASVKFGNFSNSQAPFSFSINEKANLGLNQNVDFSMHRLEDNIRTDPKRRSMLMWTAFIRGRIWNSDGLV